MKESEKGKLSRMEIKVGIKTAGSPVLEKGEGYTLVKNMLIGDSFHWQTIIEARLPGKVEKIESTHNISLINTLPIETYLECVVGSEMNPKAPLEFLKAHAVISRSWALGKILEQRNEVPVLSYRSDVKAEESIVSLDGKPESLIGWEDTASHHGFHVCSDDHCQRYQGLQDIPEVNLQSIRSTAGEVLIKPDGNIVDARFSKCCGGVTEIFSTCWQTKEEECLKTFEDPWCNLSSLSVNHRRLILTSILKDYDIATENYGYRWTFEISKQEIENNLKSSFRRNVGRIETIEAIHRGPSGRIDLLRIHGSQGCLDLGKELWIRRLLSPTHLYSSAFEIEDKGDKVRLTGRGWGHGVGLCQIGAAHMALQGVDYREILSFYYPGSRLSSDPYCIG
ncbi:MAG: SpoIID/LytB domain-containing protein [Muribaculaceae bacterium]|nr:SpoIID/LytB domain-containing protein [Muribaculaceae bacterium]